MRKTLAEHLSQVATWKQEQLEENRVAMGLATEELTMLQAQLTDLTGRIESLEHRRGTLQDVPDAIDRKVHGERHRAVLASLHADQELLSTRAADLGQARSRMLRQLEESLTQDPELHEMVQEYERFCEVETQLENLPESYRKAILQHHDTVRRRLEPVMRTAEGADAAIDDPVQTVSVVLSADPEDGDPTALVMLVPIPVDVHTRWRERPEDLASELTYRLYAAACAVSAKVGVPDAPISCRPFEGHLAIQVWFGSGSVAGNVRQEVEAELADLRKNAAELRSAKLELAATWVPPEALTAPDDEPETEVPVDLGKVKVGVNHQVSWSDDSEVPLPSDPAQEDASGDPEQRPVQVEEEASS